ncbi:hypothetical protein M0R45_030127 [Rubus argutus]|uniref:Uncharacterized protein n=1 Tax=Rubus argutus TaxID=59490 RepID=A0AAW1WAH5_RUBAR
MARAENKTEPRPRRHHQTITIGVSFKALGFRAHTQFEPSLSARAPPPMPSNPSKQPIPKSRPTPLFLTCAVVLCLPFRASHPAAETHT